ncbi:MAG TPA: hypothetical protein VGG39_00705 [Polyangiaceae bacterium]
MARPSWVPHPASWASAVALAVYAKGVAIAMALLVPLVLSLLPHAPRLAWLGVLLLWVAPIGGAAALHRATRGVLDFADPAKSTSHENPAFASVWAGFVAWGTILFVTTASALAMLVVDPPPVEPESVAAFAAFALRGPLGLVHTTVWIVMAACVYELERAARGEG